MTPKRVGASCPLCLHIIELGDLSTPAVEIEARFAEHLALHSMLEWVQCVQGLRADTAEIDHLRRIPYWAMPRA